MGWSPLWDRIVMSSIWSESNETRILWITMLALKDRDGVVKGSAIGLANAARLTVDETINSLTILQSPDPHSTSREHDGRRIQEVAGGWKVLNHETYRSMIQTEYRKEYNRVKQQEYRQKKKEKPLPGQTSHEKMANNGATESELDRHVDSLSEGE